MYTAYEIDVPSSERACYLFLHNLTLPFVHNAHAVTCVRDSGSVRSLQIECLISSKLLCCKGARAVVYDGVCAHLLQIRTSRYRVPWCVMKTKMSIEAYLLPRANCDVWSDEEINSDLIVNPSFNL